MHMYYEVYTRSLQEGRKLFKLKTYVPAYKTIIEVGSLSVWKSSSVKRTCSLRFDRNPFVLSLRDRETRSESLAWKEREKKKNVVFKKYPKPYYFPRAPCRVGGPRPTIFIEISFTFRDTLTHNSPCLPARLRAYPPSQILRCYVVSRDFKIAIRILCQK